MTDDIAKLLKDGKGKSIVLDAGVYLTSQPLAFLSGMTLIGQGATIKMAPDFPLNTPLFETPAPVGYLAVHGIDFEGNGNPAPSRGLVEFGRLDNSLFQRCGFRQHPRHLCVVAKSSRLEYLSCTFEDWGALDPLADDPAEPDGGNGLLFYDTDNLYNRVSGCTFRNGRWSAMQIEGKYWHVSRNVIDGAVEAGIFIGADSSVYTENIIRGVTQTVVSGHGMEVGGIGNIFSLNVIEDCINTGIYLTNPHDVSVSGNVIRNCANGGGNAGITVRTTGGVTEGLSINGNVITSTNGKSEYAIALYNWGGGPLQNSMIVCNNLGHSDMWQSQAILAPPNVRGKGFVMSDNAMG